MSERTIFAALSAIQADLAAKGISKDSQNTFDNYKFRGIDAMLNTLAPILAAHGVLMIPDVVSNETVQVPTQSGKVQNHTTVLVKYHFYDNLGDTVCHTIAGEGMDRGDKSLNKAFTSAYKNMLVQAFCIPLQGNDSEQDSPEIAAATVNQQQATDIKTLITKTMTDEKEYLAWLGVDSVNEIPVELYARAIGGLKRKEQMISEQYAKEQEATHNSMESDNV